MICPLNVSSLKLCPLYQIPDLFIEITDSQSLFSEHSLCNQDVELKSAGLKRKSLQEGAFSVSERALVFRLAFILLSLQQLQFSHLSITYI